MGAATIRALGDAQVIASVRSRSYYYAVRLYYDAISIFISRSKVARSRLWTALLQPDFVIGLWSLADASWAAS